MPEAGIHFQGMGRRHGHISWSMLTLARHIRLPKGKGSRNASGGLVQRVATPRCLVQGCCAECKLSREPPCAGLILMSWQFKNLSPSECPPGSDGGTSFASVCINTALYLPWLTSQCLKLGVKARRGNVSHISDAAKLHHSGKLADLIINATGLSSLKLGGVEDKNLYPARGQIVLVRNDPGNFMGSTSGTDDGPDEATYIMHRAAGGGCILGGCLQKNNWESQVDPNLATRIMKRAIELCPQLVPEGKGIEALDVIRHGVGLRPMRTGGIRIEKEVIGGVPVVHNYGHGGYGYQTSFGCAQAVEKLVKEALGGKTESEVEKIGRVQALASKL